MENDIVVKFVRTHPDAKLPTKGSQGAAGFDVYALEKTFICPIVAKAKKPVGHLVRTGWKIACPRGYEVQVRPRSGLALKYGVSVLNAPGTVDEDYRGELGIILFNISNFVYEISPGERVAQIVVKPVVYPTCVEVSSFDDATERGEKGFGSTGV